LLLIGVLSLRAQAQHWFGAPPWLSPGLLRLQQAA
jgi:hypothetical protein